jgi:light-regulated signal transduction histidine kinase (bacteriophytochrome)
LQDAYEELHVKLHAHPPALQAFLGLVLSTAAFWNPEKIQEARAARSDLADVNLQIARKSAELAALLEQRSDLHNTSGFSSDTHYHVCNVIEAASQHNYLFKSYLGEKLAALRSQFDLKYWPSLGNFLQELASDAEKAVMEATDPLTAAATSAARSSKADFFKALFAAIEESSATSYGQLPRGFKLTDRTLASLANCALDLGPDDLVDDTYMKRFRQRERNGTK